MYVVGLVDWFPVREKEPNAEEEANGNRSPGQKYSGSLGN